MKLVINEETLQKCSSSSFEFWFSYNDYAVKNIRDFSELDKPNDVGLTAYCVSLGLIPFVTVGDEELLRAYIQEKGSAKLRNIINHVKTEDFLETFWKYFNAYSELSKEELDSFGRGYMVEKVAGWCRENNIEYEIDIDL